MGQTYTENDIEKFLNVVLKSKLALSIYKQLLLDGGNTVFDICEILKNKGFKASKTRVYEEIEKLEKLNLIKRVSKRPPIYTTNPIKSNFEQLALNYFMDSREELLKRWAATYPFLTEELKKGDIKALKLSGGPMVNFNPYPIVDIFNTDDEGLKRYVLRIFESNDIYISNLIAESLLLSENFKRLFLKDNFKSLLNLLKEKNDLFGKINIKTVTTSIPEDIRQILKLNKLTSFHKNFFEYINYEMREPIHPLSSFIIGNKNLLFPIGISGDFQKTFVIIEIRDEEIIKHAKLIYNNVWNDAKLILKIVDGKIIK